MQSLFLPAAVVVQPPAIHSISSRLINGNSNRLSSASPLLQLHKTLPSRSPLIDRRITTLASTPNSAAYSSQFDDSEKAKLAQVSKRLENTSRYFKRLGSFGFWGQLVCTVVAAVILSFSVVITGKVASPATFYATSGGIAAAFVSVFWSFSYIRLSEKLRTTANDPSKAPSRAEVVSSLKTGVVVNLLGMGSTILGMLATAGLLVAKALTTSATPVVVPGRNPVVALDVFLVQASVVALDVFLVQASTNTILSHFLGIVCSLEQLRSVTKDSTPIPKSA